MQLGLPGSKLPSKGALGRRKGSNYAGKENARRGNSKTKRGENGGNNFKIKEFQAPLFHKENGKEKEPRTLRQRRRER